MTLTPNTRRRADALRRTLVPAAIGVALLAAAGVEAQVGVTPAVIEMTVPAGKPTVTSFTILPADSGEHTMRIYLGDWDRDARGENRFFEPGTQPQSCSPRLHVYPEAVTVSPGHQEVVQVVLDSLPNPQAACWSIVFVEMQAPPTGNGIRVLQRVGVKVYGLPEGPLARDGAVNAVRITPEDPGRVAIEFVNKGVAPLEPKGRLEIRTPAGETVATADIESFPILPGASLNLEVPLPTPPLPGQYLALAIFDYGGAHRVAGQTQFQSR